MGTKLWNKFSKFTESAITWGAVGVLIGAIGPFIPPTWGFSVTFVFLVAALLKTNFFEGESLLKHVFGNLVLIAILGGALFGIWRILPKPKDPPTVGEIADEVLRRQSGQHASLTQSPESSNQRRAVFQSPPTASEIADELAKRLPQPRTEPRLSVQMQSLLGEINKLLATYDKNVQGSLPAVRQMMRESEGRTLHRAFMDGHYWDDAYHFRESALKKLGRENGTGGVMSFYTSEKNVDDTPGGPSPVVYQFTRANVGAICQNLQDLSDKLAAISQ